jgi:ribosomal-protein-serine acetyltransferase
MDLAVRLRPYQLNDAPLAFAAVRESIAALRPCMPWCHPGYSIDDSRSWLATQVAAFETRVAFEFAITSAGGDYLGGCGLNQIDAANRRANLGYWVRSSAAGRGVATAAVRLLREWGFCNTDLIRLEIVIATANLASQRVAEKAGAVREGILQSRLLLHGLSHDATMYSLTRRQRFD